MTPPPTSVLAPCAGRLVPLADVPDPVFSTEMVGPGVAIDPVTEGAAGPASWRLSITRFSVMKPCCTTPSVARSSSCAAPIAAVRAS